MKYYIPNTSHLCEPRNEESFNETQPIPQNQNDELSDETQPTPQTKTKPQVILPNG